MALTTCAVQLEFVDGPDLLDYTMRCGGAVPEENVVHYFRQLLDAVAHMHAAGISHRDLKPENCMIDLRTHTLKVLLTTKLAKEASGLLHLPAVALIGLFLVQVIDFGLAAPVAAPIRPG